MLARAKLGTLVLLGIAAASGRAIAADEIHWTFTGQTSVTFDWRGAEDTIRFGLTAAYGSTVTGQTPSPLPYSSAGPFWEARLTGLQENTVYHYSIGSGPDHTFRTPLARGTSGFVLYAEGDIANATDSPRMGVIQSMIAGGRPDFVLALGDLTYGESLGQAAVDRHFNDVMVWSQDAAYMPIWGNHEWTSTTDDLRNYKGRFDLPNPQTSPGSPAISCCGEDWYWFDYGNARFIGYPESWSGAWADWGTRVGPLVDQAQSDPAIRFIVTFGHKPAYSSGTHSGSASLRTIMDSLGVHHSKYVLNLNGHSHDYERSYPQFGVVHITASPGGRNLEQASGSCLWAGGCPPPSWSAFRAMHHVAVKLQFTAGGIKGTTYCGPPGDTGSNINDITCTQGTVLDSFTIGGAGDSAPVVVAPAAVGVAEGSPLTVNVTAWDPDGEGISSLTAAPLPVGATFSAGAGNASGTLNWTPALGQRGSYPVTFTATNALSGSASTVITVGNVNQAPAVDAGPGQTITLPAEALLDGTVSDDGLPNPPGAVFTTWTVASGPGPVTFLDASAVDTRAGFTTAGTYLLRLTANDSGLAASDSVQVTVQTAPPPGAATLERRIAAGDDDAEENASGSMRLTSSDIELVYDGSNQTVGLRFANVAIAAGVTITTAYLQFEADEVQSEATNLLVQAQAADNPGPFTSTTGNVSSRARTAASVFWMPPAWTLAGEVGPGQRTPDLKSVIQQVVSRPGWASGNALAIIITGTGHRTARAYEGKAASAALLHVEFDGGGPPAGNTAPVVDAGPNQTITLPAAALLSGAASDDGLPNPPGAVTPTWTAANGPGPVTFQNPNALSTQATFTTAGTYLLRLTGSDGALSATDSVQVTVQPALPPGAATVERRIATGGDDAEENASSRVAVNGGDLELVYDKGNQWVGLRFTNLMVPRGATVTRAYLQFAADETQSEVTTLTIQAQAVDNAATFTTATGNVSTRPRTATSASWSPPAWAVVGEAAANQRTPDLAAVVQEIVSRPGWASGNALAIIITGTGHRTAESYEGKAAAAPLLHLEYTSGGPAASHEPRAAGADAPQSELSLFVVGPNPTPGPLRVGFSIAGGEPATLELMDVTGRRVASHEVGSLGPGRHQLELRETLTPGVYLVRLGQGGRMRVRKAIVLR